jgi:hypothetical protein
VRQPSHRSGEKFQICLASLVGLLSVSMMSPAFESAKPGEWSGIAARLYVDRDRPPRCEMAWKVDPTQSFGSRNVVPASRHKINRESCAGKHGTADRTYLRGRPGAAPRSISLTFWRKTRARACAVVSVTFCLPCSTRETYCCNRPARSASCA